MRASTAKKYARHRKSVLIYGGDLLKKRLGRSTPRPLSTRDSHHFVLRSTRARGTASFRNPKNFSAIHEILTRFARKHGVAIYREAVHHNHMHLSLGLATAAGYRRFIRAISAAIAMLVTGSRRGKPLRGRFWDRRPFSRIVRGPLEEANLMDYLQINQLEAVGFSRSEARRLIRQHRTINNLLRAPPAS